MCVLCDELAPHPGWIISLGAQCSSDSLRTPDDPNWDKGFIKDESKNNKVKMYTFW